ncbi:MAG: 2-oxoacid:ferredoxin oxidoreductase subunit beta [Candidatus Brocadiia bacterium]
METEKKLRLIPNPVHMYLRPHKKFPHIWCPGCSDGITAGSMIRAIDKLKISRDELVMVSGIGCASRLPVYFDFCSLHTTHGRPIAFASGVKMANPKLKVVVVTGDGDATAIGGNHFIHACRRNLDLTVILFNNNVYGMTGGQYSPTTPKRAYAATAPYGNYEPSFNIPKLAIAAGATFVARGTASNARQLESLIAQALQHKGLALVEVLSICPSVFSFYNKCGNGAQMLTQLKDTTITVEKANELRAKGETVEKWEIGILHKEENIDEFSAYYAEHAGKDRTPFSMHMSTLDL